VVLIDDMDGEIEQFWWRKDKQGVVFLLDVVGRARHGAA